MDYLNAKYGRDQASLFVPPKATSFLKKETFLQWLRLVLLLFNILVLFVFVLLLTLTMIPKFSKNEQTAKNSKKENSTTTFPATSLVQKNQTWKNENPVLKLEDIIKMIDQKGPETAQLKPILRGIIESLVYVLTIDFIILISFILIRGGTLVQKLVQIPDIELFDKNKKLAYRFLGIALLLSGLMNGFGLLAFRNDLFEMTFFIRFLLNFYFLINNSLIPILFIYTMMTFRFSIRKLFNNITNANLDEVHMFKLKMHLSDMNDLFKEIIPYFSIPLTSMFASNIFIIISSACFLMINSIRTHHSVLVFSLGLHAFIRLIMVACAGNIPGNVCRDLIRKVYENLEQWSLNEWMCFMELKRLRKEFTVKIFSMYSVRQSSILTMLGFALNYIVILLQTENYIPPAANNSTNKTNGTWLINNFTKQALMSPKTNVQHIQL